MKIFAAVLLYLFRFEMWDLNLKKDLKCGLPTPPWATGLCSRLKWTGRSMFVRRPGGHRAVLVPDIKRSNVCVSFYPATGELRSGPASAYVEAWTLYYFLCQYNLMF
ncbi:hypothetical protein SEVIR_7G218251v4 [Setaria viridis]